MKAITSQSRPPNETTGTQAPRNPAMSGDSILTSGEPLTPEDRRPDLPLRVHALLFVAMTAVCLVPVWITEHFPSQNGPWFLLIAHMLKEIGDPAWGYSTYYLVDWQPIPHILNMLLVLGFSYVAPLLTAEKLALSVYVILMPLSIFYFLSTLAPRRILVGYFSFLMVHTYAFYRGYHDFSISVPFFFITFAYWHRHRSQIGIVQGVLLALLACLTYFAHLFTFAMLACAVGYYRLLETRSLSRGVRAAVTATWPGLVLGVNYLLFTRQHSEGFTVSDTSWLLPHTATEYLTRKFLFSISFPAYVVASLPWLWVVSFLARRLWWERAQGSRQGMFSLDPIPIMFTTIGFCYFLVPYKVMGWHYVNVRMIPFIIGFVLAYAAPLKGVKVSPAFRVMFLGTLCSATAGAVLLLSLTVLEMEKTIDEYVAGIPAYAGNGRLLPILAQNVRFGQVRPITRAHEYYHIEKGGANGHGIGCYKHLTTLWYRTYPVSETFPKFDAESPDESMQHIEQAYDYVLMWGNDDAWRRRLDNSKFQLVFHQSRLHLFRNADTEESAAANQDSGEIDVRHSDERRVDGSPSTAQETL